MKNKKDVARDPERSSTPSADGIMQNPETVWEQINKYGTYNIQPTADTDNAYPEIAQGLAKTETYGKAKPKKKGL